MTVPRSWDVFCRVVDNYGDAAVCWRLARALARLHAAPRVRLWIDEPDVLHVLVPDADPDGAQQTPARVEVHRLDERPLFGTPADVAVDAFGGGLPEVYAEAMVARSVDEHRGSLWIVLEYLSAEHWVASHHGLPSPHPRLPIERYFFFPGFGPRTGGLLREAELSARRAAFLENPQHESLWRAAGFEPLTSGTRLVSLFAYENPAVPALLEAWSQSPAALVAAVPASRVSGEVAAFMGAGSYAPPGAVFRRGALEVRFLPFLPQDRYDQLLWAADWNFVRGEDSLVRAQWAERPFVWHLYPQHAGAHLAKMEAFLELYCAGLNAGLARPLGMLYRGWNGVAVRPEMLAEAWLALASGDEALRRHASNWATRAAAVGDLAINLAAFCGERLQ